MVTCDGCRRSLCSLAELTLAVPQPHGDILVAAHPWSMRSVVTTLPDPNAFVCECGNPIGKKVSWDQLRRGSCEKGDYSQYSFAVLNLARITFCCNGEFIKLDSLELLRDSVIDNTDGQLRSTALTEEQVLKLHHAMTHKKWGDDNGTPLELPPPSPSYSPSPTFQPPFVYQPPPFTYNAPAPSDVRPPPYSSSNFSEYARHTRCGNGISQPNDNSNSTGCTNASHEAFLDYLRRTPTSGPVTPSVPRGPVGAPVIAPVIAPPSPPPWGVPLSTPNHYDLAINGLHAPPHIQHLKHAQSRAHGSQVSIHSAAPVCNSAVAENNAYLNDDAAASARGSAGNRQLGNNGSGQLPNGVHLPEFLHLPDFFTREYGGILNEYDPLNADTSATVGDIQREGEIVGETRMSSHLDFEDGARVCAANESDFFEPDGATVACKWHEHGYGMRGNECSALHSASDHSGKKKPSPESREDRASKDRFKPGPGNPKFKSRYCWNFVQSSCPYGSKCAFIHSLPGDATASDAAVNNSARGGSITKDSNSIKNGRKNTGYSNTTSSKKQHKEKKDKSDISSSSNISGGQTTANGDNNGNSAGATGKNVRLLRKTTTNNSSSEPSSSSKGLHNGNFPYLPHRRVQRNPRSAVAASAGKNDAVTTTTTSHTAASTHATTHVSTSPAAHTAKKKGASTATPRKDQPKMPAAAVKSHQPAGTEPVVTTSGKAGKNVHDTQDMKKALVKNESSDTASSSKSPAPAEDSTAVRNAPQDANAAQKTPSTTEDTAHKVVEEAARRAATPARTQLRQVDTPTTKNASTASTGENAVPADIELSMEAAHDGRNAGGSSASDGGGKAESADVGPVTEATSGSKGTTAEGPKNTKGGKQKHYFQYYGTQHQRHHVTYNEGYRKQHQHVQHYGGEGHHQQQRYTFRDEDGRFKQQRYRAHHVDQPCHQQISAGNRERYYDGVHGPKNNYERGDQYAPNYSLNTQRIFTLQPPTTQSSKKRAKNEIGTMGPVKEAKPPPVTPPPTLMPPTRGKHHTVACYFYSRDGNCTNGQMCKFAHIG
eukprot:GEMP01003813.1.p1 GENE.GEMP01003813.1~~GEMP01003813.1.p1  ORF type:complete len:1053 (+),score=257.49 GEMP01003813.1:318-3476(+)